MPITAIVEGQVVAGASATGVIYVTAAGVVASDGPTWDGTTLSVGAAGDGTGTVQAASIAATAQSGTDVPLSLTGGSTPSANYVQVTTSGGTVGDVFKIDSAGDITASGVISSPGGGTQSEQFGAGSVGGQNASVFGYGANGSATYCSVFGHNAVATAAFTSVFGNSARAEVYGSAFGYGATNDGGYGFSGGRSATSDSHGVSVGYVASSAYQGVAVGSNSVSTSTGGVAVGYSSNAANLSTAIGYQSDAGHNGSTAVGAYATTTANNQIVYGRNTITEHLFPSGAVTFAGPTIIDGFTAAQVGLSIVQPAVPSDNSFQISTNGTSAGDVFKIDSAGDVTVANSLSQTPDATGKLTRGMASETHTLSLAATSDTTTISIPSGARLLAVQMNVDTAVTDGAGDDTWSAAFVTGSTTSIVTAAAAAQNTKVNLMLPDEITSGIAEIRFTPNGGSFTAGIIQITCYYEFLTSLANA